MYLRFVNKMGIPKDIELTEEPLSIGRSKEADIPLQDDKVSRVHAGIRLSNGKFYLKDLKSRNGTYVNGNRVEDTIEVKAGDRIQIGSTVFVLEDASDKENEARAIDSLENAMGDGKGYSTILKEIVEDITPDPPAPAAPPAAPAGKPSIKISRPAIKITPKGDAAAAPAEPAGDAAPKKKIIIKK